MLTPNLGIRASQRFESHIKNVGWVPPAYRQADPALHFFPDTFLDQFDEILSKLMKLVFIFSFHHNSQKRLCSGVADEDPSGMTQPLFNLFDPFCDLRKIGNRLLFSHLHVVQNLRKRLHHLSKFVEVLFLLFHDCQNLKGGEDSVTGRVVIEKDSVARLFPSQVILTSNHLLNDITIAYLRSDHLSTGLFKGFIQADIAHHRCDHGTFLKTILRQKMEAADSKDFITVHEATPAIDKDDSIRIPIQGNSNIGSFFEDESAQVFGIKGAAFEVDILSVGVNADGNDIRPQFFEDRGRNPVGCSLGTINDHPNPIQGEMIWKGIFEKNHIPSYRIIDPVA